MPDYMITLIWKEINACDTVDDKKELVRNYIDYLDGILNDMIWNSWEYE